MGGPDEITSAVSKMFSSAAIDWAEWFGIGVMSIAVIGSLAAIWYLSQFTIKVVEFPLFGSGKDGVFSIGKARKNRCRWINGKTAWNPMLPLFNKKEIEPFDSEFQYPGKQVYAYVLNDVWIPGRVNITVDSAEMKDEDKKELIESFERYCKIRFPDKKETWFAGKININKSEDVLRAEISPVPYYWRAWQSLQHKKNAQEFAEQNFWAENKNFIMMMVTIAFCLGLCALTIWWNFKYVGGQGLPGLDRLSNALNNWDAIGSK